MRSLRKNLLLNSLYQLLVVITPLLTSPYISRVLGAKGVGEYSYSFTVANYFVVFAMLGVANYGNRSISRVRDDQQQLNRTFSAIYTLQIAVSLVVVSLYVVYISLSHGNVRVLALCQILLVVSAGLDVTWLFFGLELFQITTFRSIVVKLLTVCAIFLFVKTSTDVWKYCVIMATGTFMNQVLLWPFVRKYVSWERPKVKSVATHIGPNLMFFLPVIATTIYGYVDSLMIKMFSTYTELGYYSSAQKITSIPMSLITAIGTVMLPRMSYLVSHGRLNAESKLNEQSMILSVFLSCAFTFGILGVSTSFVPLFFGSGFMEVAKLLMILAPTMLFISWANIIRNQYLLPHGKENLYTISVFLGAVINVLLNVFLIPKFGAYGASIASLTAEIIVTVAQTGFSMKNLPIAKYISYSFPFALFGILMDISIRNIYIGNDLISTAMRILIGAAIYLALSLVYFIFLRRRLRSGY